MWNQTAIIDKLPHDLIEIINKKEKIYLQNEEYELLNYQNMSIEKDSLYINDCNIEIDFDNKKMWWDEVINGESIYSYYIKFHQKWAEHIREDDDDDYVTSKLELLFQSKEAIDFYGSIEVKNLFNKIRFTKDYSNNRGNYWILVYLPDMKMYWLEYNDWWIIIYKNIKTIQELCEASNNHSNFPFLEWYPMDNTLKLIYKYYNSAEDPRV